MSSYKQKFERLNSKLRSLEDRNDLYALNKNRTDAWKKLYAIVSRSQHGIESSLLGQNFAKQGESGKEAIVKALLRDIEALSCPVCFERVGDEHYGMFIADCSHVMCYVCAKKIRANECPICRKQLTSAYEKAPTIETSTVSLQNSRD